MRGVRVEGVRVEGAGGWVGRPMAGMLVGAPMVEQGAGARGGEQGGGEDGGCTAGSGWRFLVVATQAQVMADAGVATREAADEVVERQGAGRPEAARLGVEPMAEERVVAPLARATAGMRGAVGRKHGRGSGGSAGGGDGGTCGGYWRQCWRWRWRRRRRRRKGGSDGGGGGTDGGGDGGAMVEVTEEPRRKEGRR